MTDLACDLVLAPANDGEQRVGFVVRNTGSDPADVSWFEPFVSFELAAEIDGEPARVIGGPYDGGVQRMQDVLAASEERRITTPITLAFDPGPSAPNPGPPTRWRIDHAPATTTLRATVSLRVSAADLRGAAHALNGRETAPSGQLAISVHHRPSDKSTGRKPSATDGFAPLVSPVVRTGLR